MSKTATEQTCLFPFSFSWTQTLKLQSQGSIHPFTALVMNTCNFVEGAFWKTAVRLLLVSTAISPQTRLRGGLSEILWSRHQPYFCHLEGAYWRTRLEIQMVLRFHSTQPIIDALRWTAKVLEQMATIPVKWTRHYQLRSRSNLHSHGPRTDARPLVASW